MEPAPAVQASAAAPTHRGAVLLVDDTPENLGLLAGMLKARGYRVRAAPSGPLALQSARAEAPDLVLLDISMPLMDGFEVCRRFKADEALRDVPIIFLSALSDTEDKVRAFQVGGVDYVTKPFKEAEISARVETHLELRRLRLALEGRNRELTASYQRLEHLEQVRQSLVQMVVHDLKSPLTTIGLCTEVLRQDAGLQGDLSMALDDIGNMAQVMGRMVLDVIDVSRSEQAALVPRLAPFAPADLLRQVEQEMRGMARCARRVLEVALDPATPAEVVADREMLRRVVENVLDNSFKYAPRSSTVRLALGPDGAGQWRLAVEDQGRGIPEAMRRRIFEPYARVDSEVDVHARTSRGLGLAFCRLATEAHGGHIWVEENVPQGSRFVIRLPVRAGAAAGAPASAA